MNHTVKGITKTTEQFSKDFGVPQRAIDLELMRGKAMAEIVSDMQEDTFKWSTRPSINRSHSAFVSTTVNPGTKRIFQLHGDCQGCMARVRDIYDELHAQHIRPEHPAPPALKSRPPAPTGKKNAPA